MTKAELIKALEPFDDDLVVVLVDEGHGWTNIGTVTQGESVIEINHDATLPFSSE